MCATSLFSLTPPNHTIWLAGAGRAVLHGRPRPSHRSDRQRRGACCPYRAVSEAHRWQRGLGRWASVRSGIDTRSTAGAATATGTPSGAIEPPLRRAASAWYDLDCGCGRQAGAGSVGRGADGMDAQGSRNGNRPAHRGANSLGGYRYKFTQRIRYGRYLIIEKHKNCLKSTTDCKHGGGATRATAHSPARLTLRMRRRASAAPHRSSPARPAPGAGTGRHGRGRGPRPVGRRGRRWLRPWPGARR